MQLTNDINLLFWALGGLLLGLTIGVFMSQWLGRASRAKADAELSELSATRLQLTTANGVLEQRLVGQQNQYEAQLKLLQDAKLTLGQEFENLANRIFEDKQAKFSLQNKEALEVTLSPLRRDIGDFRKQVENAYDKENADRNKLAGQISELQKQTLQISADAVSLANALRGDNKAQGNWGEFVLEKLLEDSGLSNGREYDTQVALKDESGKRRNPDVIVHLP
jgi:DNA recombination protein RmuC